MRWLGYQHVSGMDPHIAGDVHCDDGVPILKRSLDQMTGEFDVVMLNHSFEHIAEQDDALKAIRRLLAPNGRILIRIPIADSFAWRHYGVNWMHLDAPRHLFLHSPASMQLLAKRCNLRVTDLTYEGNASQFVGSEQCKRNIALVDPRSVYSSRFRRLAGWWRARRLELRAEALNRVSQGDGACFELRPT